MRHKGWATAGVLVLVVVLAAVLGVAGCGVSGKAVPATTAGGAARGGAGVSTTAGPMTTVAAASMTTTTWAGESAPTYGPATPSYDYTTNQGTDVALAGTLNAIQGSNQKIITDAQLEIEVERGKFQAVFDQALLLVDRYGGYLVNSSSNASGADQTMKSGTIAIRVPSSSLTQALSDASKLGKVTNQSLGTQDVTEEYVDLQARIKNSQAHVSALVALLGKAKTVDEVLQVQGVLSQAQQDLEQLEGRMRYLDEHTSYSTITMSIFEAGAEVKTTTAWGVGGAFSAALHNLVRAFNAIVRGLGVLIPVLIVIAILAYIIYLVVRSLMRRNRQRQQASYQAYHQGWAAPAGQPAVAGSGAAAAPEAQPGNTAAPATVSEGQEPTVGP